MGKTIGILGGMGPLATIDLFQKIVLNTPAQKDQEHLKIIIYNNPSIPARILPDSDSFQSPLPELIKSALTVERAGADFMVMPCHSAHFWFDKIKQAVSIPFYSIVENTVHTITAQQIFDSRQVLMLATDITVKSGLYQKGFAGSSVTLVTPKAAEQAVIVKAIQGVKAGEIKNNGYLPELRQIVRTYQAEGIAGLLGCCTEIPLLFPYLDLQVEKLDPTLMLAQLAVDKATSRQETEEVKM